MDDVRVTPVSDELVLIELSQRVAPCDQACRFCPRSWNTGRQPARIQDDATLDRITATAIAAVRDHVGPDVFLAADDLLAFPRLFPLLDACRDAGKRVHVASPGTALADRAFAERFVGRDIRFDLTIHALDPATAERMTGRPHAQPRILDAVGHLRDLDLEHELAIVVTADNVAALADTIRGLQARFAVDRLFLRVFYPDTPDASAAYLDQFPAFDDVVEQLASLADTPDLPVLHVSNLPPCQIDPAALDRLDAVAWRLGGVENAHPSPDLPACAACPARSRCVRVHPAYRARHPLRAPDLDAVQRVLDQATATVGDTGPPPLLRAPLGDGAELVLERRRDGRPYWLLVGDLGVYYTADGPGAARVHALMGKVRPRLDALPRLTPAVVAKVAAWVRQRMG